MNVMHSYVAVATVRLHMYVCIYVALCVLITKAREHVLYTC